MMFFCLSQIVFVTLFLSAELQAAPDSKGTDFLVSFGGNSPSNEKLVLFLSSTTDDANVTATINYYENGTADNSLITEQVPIFSKPLTVAVVEPGKIATIEISEQLRLTNTPGIAIENKTIQVQSDGEISLYGVNRAYFSGEAFLVLPTDIWGDTYFVFSSSDLYDVADDQYNVANGSQFTVIAEVDTDVNITFSVKPQDLDLQYAGKTFTTNDTLSISLIAHESLQISANVDLTGTKIESSAPVGVLSGHRRTGVEDIDGSDHLEEMIPPINTWGKEFIVPSIIYRTSYDILRILAGEDGDTTITTTDDSGSNNITLSGAGDYVELNLTSDSYYHIVGDKAIGVMQYCISNNVDNAGSDPFMIWIMPVAQYGFDYTVATAESVQTEDYFQSLAVIYKQADFAGLSINGVNMSDTDCPVFGAATAPHCDDTSEIAVAGSEYAYIIYGMNDVVGSYNLKHTNPLTTFGVLVYGQIQLEAYGYTGGSRFASLGSFCSPTSVVINDGLDNDCDSRIDEELANGIDDDGDGQIDEDTVGDEQTTTTNNPGTTTGSLTTTSTVAPTTIAQTTTVAPTTIAQTTTVAPTTIAQTTTVAPTTIAQTTTVAPTTIAQTTTVAPTTIAQTTTVAPTTIAQTTTVAPTTTSTIALTTTVAPTVTSTIAPTTTSTVEQTTTSTLAPTTTSTVAPTTTLAPTTTSTVAPTSTSTVAPTSTSTVAPTTTLAPTSTSTTSPLTTSTIAPTTTSTIALTTTIAPTTTTIIAPTTTSTISSTTTSTISPTSASTGDTTTPLTMTPTTTTTTALPSAAATTLQPTSAVNSQTSTASSHISSQSVTAGPTTSKPNAQTSDPISFTSTAGSQLSIATNIVGEESTSQSNTQQSSGAPGNAITTSSSLVTAIGSNNTNYTYTDQSDQSNVTTTGVISTNPTTTNSISTTSDNQLNIGNTEAQRKSNVPVIVGATVPTLLLVAAATGACIWYMLVAKRKKLQVGDGDQKPNADNDVESSAEITENIEQPSDELPEQQHPSDEGLNNTTEPGALSTREEVTPDTQISMVRDTQGGQGSQESANDGKQDSPRPSPVEDMTVINV